MSKNERKTENIVRDKLRALNFFEKKSNTRVEEQKSTIEAVKKALRSASKSGKENIGSPEFIISNPSNPDFLIIVECKASVKDHISRYLKRDIAVNEPETDDEYTKRVRSYAVDGVIHYASKLSREYNVIAIAVSGENEAEAKISCSLITKGQGSAKILHTKGGKPVEELLSWNDFIEHATFDTSVQKMRFSELMEFSRELHEFMRDHAKLTESQKPLLVSGTLIALRNDAFSKSFDSYSPDKLQKAWMRVIKEEIEDAEIPKAKKDNMTQPYTSIAVHPALGKATEKYPKGILHELIRRLNDKVWPFINKYHDFDVVGQFYGEFLKYTGGDKKALGIVLTPRHITELFALLANVNKDSKVLDICAGTGGFLISAMHQMMRTAVSNRDKDRIKSKGLIGVEEQPDMFCLAASNMILRGDGKANLRQGSCFNTEITKELKDHKCNIGLLNPPFSQSDADQQELHFVKHMLDCLTKGGTGIAIVPMSCAISPHPVREELLKSHTLEAVMSMPQELFYPVGVVTCVMVFTAKIPHETSNKKTWFGFWKNDGFIKTKHLGRIDLNHNWHSIRDRWIEQFYNREEHIGECIKRKVGADDEWCAEAYLETDYSTLTSADFEAELKRYLAFRLLNDEPGIENEETE